MNTQPPQFVFDNTYATQLEGYYVPWQGEAAPQPEIVALNRDLAEDLGLDAAALDSPEGAAIFSGSVAPEGATPLAQAYAGHQFGGFSQQLGDGRALLLGEVIDRNGNRRDIQLKGSGRTPFSRGGDGKAVLGPVLREYLIGEAMHALGIPTTRALAAVTTGEKIAREGMQPGAVLARVASSHLRVGTFQFFAARGEQDKVRTLADYAIARHYPDLADSPTKYLEFLKAVIDAQAALVAKWLHVGFVHGVMNTDNVTISGETIDYGPCAFVDAYDPNAVFSSIDQNGRYAFANQPGITQWNLARFAETLLALLDADEDNAVRIATNQINAFKPRCSAFWLDGMRRKIGLVSSEPGDADLANDALATMDGQSVDHTLFFRHLARAANGDTGPVLSLFDNAGQFSEWLPRWQDRLSRDPQTPESRVAAMDAVNPVYIPRNHMVEAALTAAWQDGNLAPFHDLLDVVKQPFTKRDGLDAYEGPATKDFGPYRTFCGT